MSRRVFPIDKIIHDVLTETAGQGFTLHELNREFCSRSNQEVLPPGKQLFWQIYMQIFALKIRKLVRRVDRPEGGGFFFVEEGFMDYPLDVVERLLIDRWS